MYFHGITPFYWKSNRSCTKFEWILKTRLFTVVIPYMKNGKRFFLLHNRPILVWNMDGRNKTKRPSTVVMLSFQHPYKTNTDPSWTIDTNGVLDSLHVTNIKIKRKMEDISFLLLWIYECCVSFVFGLWFCYSHEI